MKTDKTKNWTDSWKEQLDEYSVTPPPEVWEELSKELAPRRIPFRKRTIWWAAACITLLLCTFIGLQFLRPTTDLNNLPLQTKISGSEQMEVSRMQNTSFVGAGEYPTRFAIVALMDFYLDDEYKDRLQQPKCKYSDKP